MTYEQSLYTTEKISAKFRDKAKKWNRTKKFEYGYDEEWDFVVISKTGQIDIDNLYVIQGLRIAIPPQPKKEEIAGHDLKKADQVWTVHSYPEELKKIKTVFEWDKKPANFKDIWWDYIERAFNWRQGGYWFMSNGRPTYITGSHYMFMTWSYIDIGLPHYREANRIFWYFWEACKADFRSYGMCYLKNRRSGFSYMASSEISNLATQTKNSRYGILSKTNGDAKLLFTDKVVRIVNNYPFFFKPIMAGSDKPKSEMVFDIPARKLTRRSMKETDEETADGLNTSIDYKSTGDYSYDGEKLKLLIQDESGKWEKPANVKKNHAVTRTCCRLGIDIIGKIMMGSTAGALDKGGDEFKDIYYGSDLRTSSRDGNGQTEYGLYSLFIPMEWNYEGTFDKFGMSIFEDPNEPVLRYGGDINNKRHFIKRGALSIWQAEYDGRKNDSDSQNAYLRQYPKTEKQAFRDEAENSLFNLTRIHDQIDHNEDLDRDVQPVRGNFQWQNGVKDSRVEWMPSPQGRFLVSWLPPQNMSNIVTRKQGQKFPGNEHLGAFGCDPYDISQAQSRGSKAACHGLLGHHWSAEQAPTNRFFLEYIARPQDADIFFEDILMATVYYGMPILAENNKARLLYHFRRRGYRNYSLNRPDKVYSKLSYTEKEIGGIPMTGADVLQSHAAAIESWINKNVGLDESGKCMNNIKFSRTLEDWSRFDFEKRTKHDATISSGLAIMAVQRNMYAPAAAQSTATVQWKVPRYNNGGNQSIEIK